jgi:hypothetical protein
VSPVDDLAVLSTTLGQMVLEATGEYQMALGCFAFLHLPPHLQPVSAMFARVAVEVASGPHNREALKALDRLIEAKDAAVRARAVRL